MPRAQRTCNTCPSIVPRHQSRCDQCTLTADRDRGTAHQRGYTNQGHQAFRSAVLTRDPICIICKSAWATIADHWPLSRRELLDAGMDPNDPQHGRGLCKTDHDRETATNQPGGWNTTHPVR